MIWFFIAGWISGFVAAFMILRWWAIRHMVVVSVEEKEEKKDD